VKYEQLCRCYVTLMLHVQQKNRQKRSFFSVLAAILRTFKNYYLSKAILSLRFITKDLLFLYSFIQNKKQICWNAPNNLKKYKLSNGQSIERNPFPAKNLTLNILHSIYFAYEVGIISSYSNRIQTVEWAVQIVLKKAKVSHLEVNK